MKRLGEWLAETPAGRATFRLSVLALATLCVGGAVFAVIVNFGQESRITRIEHSACQKDPAGHECQQTKLEASKAANLVTTCVPFWKAGYPCPRPGSRAARQHQEANLEESSGPAPARSQTTTGGITPGAAKGPSSGHDHEHGRRHKPPPSHHAPPSTTPPSAPPAPSTPQPEPSPPATPGNSGETPAAEHGQGVTACVNIVVSTCAEAGVPKLLP